MPRAPPESASSLLSTRYTSRLKAKVTNASHGPRTRSAGIPIRTLNTMLTATAMGIVHRNGRSGRSTVSPQTETSRPVSRRIDVYAPIPRKAAWAMVI